MPIYKQGNMWDVYGVVDYFLVTTNAHIKRNGELVMGRGIAAQAKAKDPKIPLMFGTLVKMWRDSNHIYGCIPVDKSVGLFQVKYHWKDKADLELIQYSTLQLKDLAETYPDRTYALNFPGIGNGRLRIEDVKPIIDQLPNNVQVWTY